MALDKVDLMVEDLLGACDPIAEYSDPFAIRRTKRVIQGAIALANSPMVESYTEVIGILFGIIESMAEPEQEVDDDTDGCSVEERWLRNG